MNNINEIRYDDTDEEYNDNLGMVAEDGEEYKNLNQ